jgi:hypothetical protein
MKKTAQTRCQGRGFDLVAPRCPSGCGRCTWTHKLNVRLTKCLQPTPRAHHTTPSPRTRTPPSRRPPPSQATPPPLTQATCSFPAPWCLCGLFLRLSGARAGAVPWQTGALGFVRRRFPQ